MDDLARTVELPPAPVPEPVLETSRSRVHLLAPSAAPPAGCDAIVALPDGTRVAYVPLPEGAGGAAELTPDPFVRGNQFKPLLQGERTLAALLSVANGRRLDTGPESERVFLFLRGSGLLFLENGDTHRFAERVVGVAPPGEPARLWSQGPEDLLAVVFQPRGERVERRTLAGEIRKRRDAQ